MYLDANPYLYAGLIHVLRRGTAILLEESAQGIFLKDSVSQFSFLAVDSCSLGVEWLMRHERESYAGLCVFDPMLASFAKKRYAFSTHMTCFQAVYPFRTPPPLSRKLRIRPASPQDLETVAAHYHHVSTNELAQNICLRNLFLGYRDDTMVGFVGQHLEGAIGLLEVLPKHRGQGYGRELEGFMIARMLEDGYLPFCQVEEENEASLGLQRSLGMRLADGKMYFVY